jgi:hypothetical protein
MAGPHEIALGIASIVGKSGVPNPMPISFLGQSLDGAAEVVKAIISECDDAGIVIDRIELDRELHRNIVEGGHAGSIRLVVSDDLIGEMRLFAK